MNLIDIGLNVDTSELDGRLGAIETLLDSHSRGLNTLEEKQKYIGDLDARLAVVESTTISNGQASPEMITAINDYLKSRGYDEDAPDVEQAVKDALADESWVSQDDVEQTVQDALENTSYVDENDLEDKVSGLGFISEYDVDQKISDAADEHDYDDLKDRIEEIENSLSDALEFFRQLQKAAKALARE
jgi:uncharacterized phage infection (PIP) family protein YhgE